MVIAAVRVGLTSHLRSRTHELTVTNLCILTLALTAIRIERASVTIGRADRCRWIRQRGAELLRSTVEADECPSDQEYIEQQFFHRHPPLTDFQPLLAASAKLKIRSRLWSRFYEHRFLTKPGLTCSIFMPYALITISEWNYSKN